MLFKIEEACKASSNVPEILDPLAPSQGAADMWEAVYEPFEHTKIKIHAVHLAASLGSTEVLEWLQDHCSPDVLCCQSIIETASESWQRYLDHVDPGP